MNDIRLTVIIPFYNALDYLEKSINSALKQSIDGIEIICIDDGSNDGSGKLADKLSDEYECVKVYHQHNMGAGPARNKGIELAGGEYVSFLDSDDYYYTKTALEEMVEFCEKNRVNICGSYRVSNINGCIEQADLLKEFDIQDGGVVLRYEDVQYDFDYQSFIFKRSFLVNNDIYFPSYIRYQDPPFFVRAMVCAKRFGVVPIEMYCYRMGHQDKRVIERGINDLLKGVEDVLRLATTNGLNKLFYTTLYRINDIYYESIIKNLTLETIESLVRISRIVEEGDSVYGVRIVDEMKSLETILKSNYILERISLLLEEPSRIQEYFEDIGAKRIVIHGCGLFGKHMVRIIKKTRALLVAAIDRTGKSIYQEFAGIPIFSDLADVPENDLIIITVLNSDDILLQYNNSIKYVLLEDIVQLV